MISIWHLFWIIPLSVFVGIWLVSLLIAGKENNYNNDDN